MDLDPGQGAGCIDDHPRDHLGAVLVQRVGNAMGEERLDSAPGGEDREGADRARRRIAVAGRTDVGADLLDHPSDGVHAGHAVSLRTRAATCSAHRRRRRRPRSACRSSPGGCRARSRHGAPPRPRSRSAAPRGSRRARRSRSPTRPRPRSPRRSPSDRAPRGRSRVRSPGSCAARPRRRRGPASRPARPRGRGDRNCAPSAPDRRR